MRNLKLRYLVLVVLTLSPVHLLFGQGTAFTYQGQLKSNGVPANGTFDFQFSVYDAPTNGNLMSQELPINQVGVTNGLFTVLLDFQSASVFDGSARWLAIQVMPHGGTGGFNLLQPLQPITPAPYAITAGNAGSSLTINATNLSGVTAAAQGGLGIANTNLVPSGARYSATNDPNAGEAFYFITLNTNVSYFAIVPEAGAGNDNGVYWDWNTGAYNNGISANGIFRPTNTVVELVGVSNSSLIGTQIYPIATNLYGYFGGQFDGTLTADSSVPASALPGNIQYQRTTLNAGASNYGSLNSIYSMNPTGVYGSPFDPGSTLSLWHAGPSGFTDINFHSTASVNNLYNPSAYTSFFSIGVGGHSIAQDGIYFNPYLETYGAQYPFYFVGNAEIFGGLYSSANRDGDFIWYQDGTTNTPMFRINRASGIISNYNDAVFTSNLTSATMTLSGATGLNNFIISLDDNGNFVPTSAPKISGANITSLNAGSISAGTFSSSLLGSGPASSNAFLRGNSTWSPLTSGDISSLALNPSNLSGTVPPTKLVTNAVLVAGLLVSDGTNLYVTSVPNGLQLANVPFSTSNNIFSGANIFYMQSNANAPITIIYPPGVNTNGENWPGMTFNPGGPDSTQLQSIPAHSGGGEFSAVTENRFSITWGNNEEATAALQLGPANAPGAGPAYLTQDGIVTGYSAPFGTSLMLGLHATWWNTNYPGNISGVNYKYADTRVEVIDTNGNAQVVTYDIYNANTDDYAENHTGPGSAPPGQPFAFINTTTRGVLRGGLTRSVDVPSISSTNYGVNWDDTNGQRVSLNISTNLNLTNVPNIFGRTNQFDVVDLEIYPGKAGHLLTSPTNWNWAGGTVLTNIPGSTKVELEITQETVSGVTSYWVKTNLYPYSPANGSSNALQLLRGGASVPNSIGYIKD